MACWWRGTNNIAETTDVAARPEFTARRAEGDRWRKAGRLVHRGFHAGRIEDAAREGAAGALRPESMGYDGQFQIVTFEEVIDFVAAEAAARGRTIGIIPRSSIRPISTASACRWRICSGAVKASRVLATMPMIVQSFEIANSGGCARCWQAWPTSS
jgi:glycerophosphoryl diester phosphodiesterase